MILTMNRLAPSLTVLRGARAPCRCALNATAPLPKWSACDPTKVVFDFVFIFFSGLALRRPPNGLERVGARGSVAALREFRKSDTWYRRRPTAPRFGIAISSLQHYACCGAQKGHRLAGHPRSAGGRRPLPKAKRPRCRSSRDPAELASRRARRSGERCGSTPVEVVSFHKVGHAGEPPTVEECARATQSTAEADRRPPVEWRLQACLRTIGGRMTRNRATAK